MKIALAHDHLFQLGGAEQVLKELSDLYPEAPIYTLIYKKENFSYFHDKQIITSILQKMPGGISFFKWYLSMMPRAWENFDFSEYDVVISSSSGFVKGIVTPDKTRHFCYCHTPTRYLWSDRVEYMNNLSLPHIMKIYLTSVLDKLQVWDKTAASRVDHFIANSKFIAKRIKKYYHRDSTIIYPPVDTSQFYISSSTDDYYLIVSRLRPYKKVKLAIEAFNHLRIPLIVIGGGEEIKHLKKIAKKNIKFLGEVSNATRNRYLSRCKAFIHPQEEDFGISAVEAMASGRPVIAYKAGGALETVLPGETGTFFTEQTWESLLYAILHFNSHDYDPYAISKHAEQFNREEFQSKISNLINQEKNDQ